MSSKVYAIRGAITVENNEKEEILTATKELLLEIKDQNQLDEEDIISIFFTMTPDLNAVFPAQAARQIGWDFIPLLDATEVDVPGGLAKCIRVLIHLNSNNESREVEHVYLRRAEVLRPDLIK
ncbi:chorismate mutase [Selenihalanaerobacter shriftii]|uniref:chorismate mutase n=1 Tax=Selenihalanaerobacter shriftii TaxID=142842 RepID=A0A1T4LIZ2_9FIRM|nr:chorismate mutase [Selenihalanaerobacter shriftii]SJZ54712.1 chorismate mutase [Selenihalanaerobacter shriftii]